MEGSFSLQKYAYPKPLYLSAAGWAYSTRKAHWTNDPHKAVRFATAAEARSAKRTYNLSSAQIVRAA